MILGILAFIIAISMICALAGSLAALFDSIDNQELANKDSVFGVISFVILVFSLIAFFCINNHFDKIKYTYPDEPTSIEYITAVKDNSEVNGSIHGGRYYTRGYINEVSYYSYMIKRNDGGIVSNKVPTSRTTIYEVSDNFRVEWYVKTKKWLGITDEIKYWKIYIPEGSVTDDYNIDLE